ncbi:hypothetical protein PFISCL1PPCAC_458, partial [Pristionchus fissidentatus]
CCQPPTPAFSAFSQPAFSPSFSQPSYAQGFKSAFNSYTPSFSQDAYSGQQPAPAVAPPPPIPPSNYAQGGLEPFSGKMTSGVATGEGTYTGSAPAAFAKYAKVSKHFEPYPGYVPPPAGPEDNLLPYPHSAPQPPPGESNPPLNLAGLQGLSLGVPPPNQGYPQLVQQPPTYQQTPLPQQQQQQQFSSYVQQPQAGYAQKLVPGQMFNGNSMVPHYQSVIAGDSVPPPPDCSQLSLSSFPHCVENRPGITTSASALACTFEQGTTCRFDASTLNIATISNPNTRKAFSKMMGRSDAPEGGFGYQLIEHPKGDEITIGTAITCQRGNGVLKLSYWLSNPTEIDFKVCTQDHIARSCTQPIAYSSPSSVIVEVVHPNATVFDVEVVVANVMHPLLFVIDSLEYRADLCEDEKQPQTGTASKSSSTGFFDDDAAASSNNSEKDRAPRGEEEGAEGETVTEEKHEEGNRSDRAFHAKPPTLTEQQFQVDPAEYDHEATMPASEDVAYENSVLQF